jgi:integrase
MLMSALIALWCDYRSRMCQLDMVAPSTIANQRAIAFTLQTAFPNLDVADLRKSHVEFFIGERRKTCQPVTIRGEMNVLRQILNWAVDEGHLLVKPRLPQVQVPMVETALPADEAFVAMLAALPAHHRDACEFMMLTGLSPHELDRVQRRDGPFEPGAGWLLNIGYRDDFKVKTASRKRQIPLNNRAVEIWQRWQIGLAPEGKPFPNADAIQKAMSRTGLPGITPKSMRKWFASHVSNENPEHVLQRLMGHSPGSKITRQHYVRSTDEATRGAVDGLGVGIRTVQEKKA